MRYKDLLDIAVSKFGGIAHWLYPRESCDDESCMLTRSPVIIFKQNVYKRLKFSMPMTIL